MYANQGLIVMAVASLTWNGHASDLMLCAQSKWDSHCSHNEIDIFSEAPTRLTSRLDAHPSPQPYLHFSNLVVNGGRRARCYQAVLGEDLISNVVRLIVFPIFLFLYHCCLID